MGSSLFKFRRKHLLALAIGLGAIGGPLATAQQSFAATLQPGIGAACQADGKISGAGSTFQTNAVNNAFTFGYQQDVCGPQASVSGLYQGGTFTGPNGVGGTINSTAQSWAATDPSVFNFTVGLTHNAVSGMIAYNYSLGLNPTSNGSGAGLNRLSCRMDMFAGTDLPYNDTQLAAIDGAPGSLTAGTNAPWNASPYKCDTYADAGMNAYTDGATGFTGITNVDLAPPPYGPQSYGSWPATGDVAAKAMGLPVAGGAVAFVANLKVPVSGSGGCTTAPPSGTHLSLTPAELDGIWQGTINVWTDPVLQANNGFLATDGCTGPIQRVVRGDNSGTTAITMFTLNGYNSSTTLCNPGSKASNVGWYDSATSSNNTGFWPEGCSDTNVTPATSASNEVNNGSGSPNLISYVEAHPGTIGYAELGLWGTIPAGDVEVQLATPATQNSSTPTYILPGTANKASNCAIPSTPPPGASANASVGLGTGATWSNFTAGTSGTSPGAQDIADPAGGTGYPACGLTFDMVYTGQSESGEVAAPSTPTATPGCTITAPAGTTAAGGQTLPVTTLNVASTSGYPASGTITIDGQTLTYTGVTATAFTGVSGGTSGTVINAGDAVAFVSTHAAATSAAPGVNGACQTVGGSLAGITNDQQRTLYSYFSYIYSPLGQDETALGATNTNLQNQTLDPLPAAWLPYLIAGFQTNF